MPKKITKKWILAYKYGEAYTPEAVYDSEGEALEGLEYGDIVSDEYQLWEYPSGKIFKIQPDRKVAETHQWSVADKEYWQPELQEIGVIDTMKIEEIYKRL